MTRVLLLLALVSAPVCAQEEVAPPVEQAAPPAPQALPPVAPPPDQLTDYWPAPAPPRPRPSWHGHVMFQAGGAFHELYGIPYGTASLTLRFGAEIPHFGAYAELIGEAGAALPRLPIENIRGGFQLHYINGRFRAGAGSRFGGIIVGRATGAATDNGFSWSVYAMFSADVVRWPRGALYLGVEVGFDVLLFSANAEGATDSDLSPIATLQLGFRL